MNGQQRQVVAPAVGATDANGGVAGGMTRAEKRIDVLFGRVHAQEVLLKAVLEQCVDRDGLLRRLEVETEQMGHTLRDSDCSLLMYAAFMEHTTAMRDSIAAKAICAGRE